MLAFVILSHERQFYVVIFSFLLTLRLSKLAAKLAVSYIVPSFNSVVDKLRTLDQLHAAAMPWRIG